MVVKSGRFGKFLACPNYPTCKSTLPFGEKRPEKQEGVCPKCGKPTLRLRTRTGKTFYGCSGYPACDFKSWDMPTGEKCPKCGGAIVKTARGTVRCSNKDCSYKAPKERAEKAND